MSRKQYKLPNAKQDLAMLRNVIAEVTGACRVTFEPQTWDSYPWGYIDHQSIEDDGGAGMAAFETYYTLKNFIFDTRSILFIDNDNH